ncbi:MAG: PfkB family carbohydrate kinase, partial [Holophagales bacterium]|nr:PfkB family carbohydrate kinase [Holophagales bacterium]
GTGQRAILSRGAWGLRLGPGSFDPTWLNAADVLLLDGHLLEAAIAAAEQAQDQGIPVVLDGGSWKEGLERLLPLVDHAICGEHFRPPGCLNFAQVFRYLEGAGVVERAITRGPKSILYRGRGVEAEIEVPRVKAVDTSAAGDIFHGAYAFHLTRNAPPASALAQAAELASRACTVFGPRRWMGEGPEPPGSGGSLTR